MESNTNITLEIKGFDIYKKWVQLCMITNSNKLIKGWLITELSCFKHGKVLDSDKRIIDNTGDSFTVIARKIR